MSIYITPDNGSITMKGSGLVTINTSIKIYGTGTELPIKIVADFNNIPHNLHSLYYQSLISNYNTNIVAHKNLNEVDDEPYPMTIEEKQKEWRWNRLAKLVLKAIKK
jgi:hypothetical protein